MKHAVNRLSTADPAPVSPRERMVRQQVADRGITDDRLLEVLRSVPREAFFPPDQSADAHADRAADIGHGQTISQPYVVALMTDRLALTGTERVLEVGTGSGYQTAVLARLAAEVYTVERVKPLLDDAFERLAALGAKNVRFRHGDGSLGWPDRAPFNRVLIAAGAPELPRRLLLDQLVDGGVAVLPVGPAEKQMLVRVVRRGGDLDATNVCPVRFVPLIGEQGWPT